MWKYLKAFSKRADALWWTVPARPAALQRDGRRPFLLSLSGPGSLVEKQQLLLLCLAGGGGGSHPARWRIKQPFKRARLFLVFFVFWRRRNPRKKKGGGGQEVAIIGMTGRESEVVFFLKSPAVNHTDNRSWAMTCWPLFFFFSFFPRSWIKKATAPLPRRSCRGSNSTMLRTNTSSTWRRSLTATAASRAPGSPVQSEPGRTSCEQPRGETK